MRRGTRSRSVMAVAATAFGGEMMAPSKKPAACGIPVSQWASQPIFNHGHAVIPR